MVCLFSISFHYLPLASRILCTLPVVFMPSCEEESQILRRDGNAASYHNIASFKKKWQVVGENTAVRWKATASLGSLEKVGPKKEILRG